jgi:hypothetical protein
MSVISKEQLITYLSLFKGRQDVFATYIWHFEKTMDALRNGLSEIEGVLNEIRNTGKQDYLNKDHPTFSRIMHDYSAAQKGV